MLKCLILPNCHYNSWSLNKQPLGYTSGIAPPISMLVDILKDFLIQKVLLVVLVLVMVLVLKKCSNVTLNQLQFLLGIIHTDIRCLKSMLDYNLEPMVASILQ